jgi:hypothetical protein
MSNPTPDYEAMHRAVALAAAAQVYTSTEVTPHQLVTHAVHLCAYLDDGTGPPKEGWFD